MTDCSIPNRAFGSGDRHRSGYQAAVLAELVARVYTVESWHLSAKAPRSC